MRSPEEADPRYAAALAALGARGRFGMRLGLGRTRALLRRLGDPHAGIRGVLIGGTNGKGSTQALVASALRAGGYRVGQTPKPHLTSYRERIVVDGRLIPAGEFARTVETVLRAADDVGRRLGPPTEFEALTAAAFAYFSRERVDVAVVEVGMGGRLDATNVWQGGVTAITNVALDHMEHLGDTITAIAREKAAIIKRGDHAAVTAAESEGLDVIARRAHRVAVPLQRVAPLPVLGMDRGGLLLAADGDELRIGLLGRHQAANAAVAVAVLGALEEAGIAGVARDRARVGLAQARWPGRLELLAVTADGVAHPAGVDAPDTAASDLVLDGAHNPHGTAALAAAIDELAPLLSPGRPTLLMGVLADKDVRGILEPLTAGRVLGPARVITTSVPDSPRSLDAATLSDAWNESRPPTARGHAATPIDDPARALEAALEESARVGGPLVVCGSLYLVGFLRGRLVDDELADPGTLDPER